MNRSSRIVATLRGNGTITTDTQPVPELGEGMVCIAVRSSLVSPGTEFGGWDNLASQLRAGLPAAEPRPFGYSAAGEVVDVGEGVDRLAPGSRVAAIGVGHALHTNIAVVPQNLCVPMPDDVSYDDGAYAMLLATALHAVRRATPEIGEHWLVVGLGIVGMLAARFLQLSGCFVAGMDHHHFRVDLARDWLGIEAVRPADTDGVVRLRESTSGAGFDGAVIAFGGEGDEALDTTVDLMKASPDGHPVGTIVVVGWPTFSYERLIGGMNNIDLRRASRTGPGYHDERWERGEDYPPVFVRWSTRENLKVCFEFVRRGQVAVDRMTTHRIPLRSVEDGIAAALAEPGRMLGVIFTNE